eukprot:1158790-Pelagomonas_calceolata.AAC.5
MTCRALPGDDDSTPLIAALRVMDPASVADTLWAKMLSRWDVEGVSWEVFLGLSGSTSPISFGQGHSLKSIHLSFFLSIHPPVCLSVYRLQVTGKRRPPVEKKVRIGLSWLSLGPAPVPCWHLSKQSWGPEMLLNA